MDWWSELRDDVRHLAAHIRAEWTFTFAKTGWTLRLYDRDRVLLYLIPQHVGFLVGIVLGPRAVDAARAANRTGPLPTLLNQAVHNPEGLGLRFPVRSAETCRLAKQLARIKLETT